MTLDPALHYHGDVKGHLRLSAKYSVNAKLTIIPPLLIALSASDPGEAVVQDTSAELAVNELSHIMAEEAVFVGKT